MLNEFDDLGEFDRAIGTTMFTAAGFVVLAVVGLVIWAIWKVMS